MYIIAGLGNPTKDYEKTRHNVGFMAVDALADKLGISLTERKYRAFCGRGMLGTEKVLLLKPQTYMNNSGESIREAADFFKVDPAHVIVLYDDISLDVGKIRVRAKGSAGGHNGMKSIIQHLGSQEFKRVRVGIGDKPPQMDLADYVLGRFSKADAAVIEEAAKTAADAVTAIVTKGIDAAMNAFN
ncbi:MAG: aminoacyl-tRNA hydrolase [bacterium]|nr:aminoacyl-tRNA hydrolase [bacterium]